MKPFSVATMAALAGLPLLVPAMGHDPVLECPSKARLYYQALHGIAIDARPEAMLPEHPSMDEGKIIAARRFDMKIWNGSTGQFLVQITNTLPGLQLSELHGGKWEICVESEERLS
ncbi:BgTH12-07820 [Blumeria graminis f. sp. triticale]|uniref:BgTH12-07820 n=1 Tax=Blumeria graminis f. sp. triticale TaxID=1689686 RepID=A0A9W4DRC6_BLUGR|nr:BgTH12-07820 [Blumeria graminis f. sp. triticale]